MARCLAGREQDYYAGLAEGYDRLHKEEQERKISLILEHFPIAREDRLLDVGCGTGLSFALWPARDITGAEPSAAMIAQAPTDVQARIMQVRAEDLSIFEDEEFDVVASVTAIQNFTGIEDGLREMRRVGKGRFAFSVLRKSEKLSAIDRLIREFFPGVRVVDSDPHDRLYLVGGKPNL